MISKGLRPFVVTLMKPLAFILNDTLGEQEQPQSRNLLLCEFSPAKTRKMADE